jgi:hypothetical protein
MRITAREDVQACDIVTWGSLGYVHQGVAQSDPDLWDGELAVSGGLDWWSDFLWADRALVHET